MVLTTCKSLEHSVKNGPRLFVPSQDELEAVLVGKKLTTTLFFLDETFEDITYDITTTIGEVVQVETSFIFCGCIGLSIIDLAMQGSFFMSLSFRKNHFVSCTIII